MRKVAVHCMRGGVHAIHTEMKQQIEAVIDSSKRLQQIRERLAAIEDERAALEAEAKEILGRIGLGKAISGAPEWKDGRLPLTRRILSFLAAHPMEQFRIAALARALGLSHPDYVQNLRGALARLAKEHRVIRSAAGVYSGKPGAV